MERLIAGRYEVILIDCAGIEKIDCAGLGEFARAQANAQQLNVQIALFNLDGHLLDLLVMTKLVTLFPCLEDLALPRAA
jgi:anti-anti-sigma factor